MEYKLYNDQYVPKPFGLSNTGVICWCNSLIQVLLGCPALNETLLEYENILAANQFAREYIRMVKIALYKPDDPQYNLAASSAAIIGAFIVRLRSKGNKTRFGYSQECTDEAFTLFVDMFDHPAVARLFVNSYELKVVCKKCNNVVSEIRDKSHKINIYTNNNFTSSEEFCRYLCFHVSPLINYKCACGHIEPMHFRTETLKVLREIVVVVFYKFHKKEIRYFPPNLTFMGLNGGHIKYKLVGQVEHSGTMSGGHYRAFTLRQGTWYHCNDSSVHAQQPASTPETYMVVYHMDQ